MDWACSCLLGYGLWPNLRTVILGSRGGGEGKGGGLPSLIKPFIAPKTAAEIEERNKVMVGEFRNSASIFKLWDNKK